MLSTQTLRWGCASFIFGCAIAPQLPATIFGELRAGFILGLFVVAIGIIFSRRRFCILVSCIACVCGLVFTRVQYDARLHHDVMAKSVEIQGHVTFIEYTFSAQRLLVVLHEPVSLSKKNVLLYVRRYPLYRVGDVIHASCRLQAPEQVETAGYRDYLARRSIDYTCVFPRSTVVGQRRSLQSYLMMVNEYYARQYNQHIIDPENAFIQATVINRAGEIPDTMRKAFSSTGIAHIISISGLHISVIILVLDHILIAFAIGRRFRFVLVSVFACAYLVLLGFPAAAVRSVIMGILVLFGKIIGRPTSGIHILIVTAAVMALVNPLIVRFDIGYQLSFLALAGILITAEPLQRLLWFITETAGMRAVVATSLAAQVLTWPLVAYYFGVVSLSSPLINILVLPLSAPVLILAFIYPLTASMPVIGNVILWPLFFLARTVIFCAYAIARLPFSSLALPSGSGWMLMLGFALSMLSMGIISRKKTT